jgi:hypothetical protein
MRGFDCKTPHWVSTASMSLKCKNSNSKWTSLPAAAARLIQRSTPACCACLLLTVTGRPGEQSLMMMPFICSCRNKKDRYRPPGQRGILGDGPWGVPGRPPFWRTPDGQ